MIQQAASVRKQAQPEESSAPAPTQRSSTVAAALLALAFAGLLFQWLLLDNRVPAMDEANGILHGFSYADLLHHPKLWNLHWWHQFLTVNQFYPPAAYILSGLLKLVLGPARWVDSLLFVALNLATSLSLYSTTRALTGKGSAGIAAILILNLFPHVTLLSHFYLLDYPLVAMVSLALWSIVWFRQAPTFKRAIVTGAAIGAACLTKQIAGAFLALPILFLAAETIRDNIRTRNFRSTQMLATMVAVAGILFLPWLMVNASALRAIADYNSAHMAPVSFWQSVSANFAVYSTAIIHTMSPCLFAFLLLALVLAARSGNRLLLIPALSAIGGLMMISCITVTPPLDRYVTPALISAAIYCGYGLARLFDGAGLTPKLTAGGVVLLALIQHTSFFYMPYPLSKPAFLDPASRALGVCLRDYRGVRIERNNPRPPQDWGQDWVLGIIDQTDPGKPVWLNILPNTGDLNVHTYELLAKYRGSSVRPTTSRQWTLAGDIVQFSPESALYYQWYLLADGEQGNVFENNQSQRNYYALIEYVKTGGNFKFIAQKQLPDGSVMQLFRQR